MKDLRSSVHKTFALLEYFDAQKPEWGVTELANAAGSNKSTVYRFLSDMEQLGIVQKQVHSDKYALGLKLYELGCRVPLRSAFVDKTHPALLQVAANITETVHVAVLKNHQVFYVDKVESPQGLKVSSQIGSYNPAYATSLGKVLLAYQPEEELEQTLAYLTRGEMHRYTDHTIIDVSKLENELQQIREQGYAIDREEFEIGLICVAIPIYNQNNEVVASLSASGPANRFKEKEVKNYIAILQEGADDMRQRINQFKP